jgi:hypothetical protein
MMLCSCVRQRQLLKSQAGQPRLTNNMRAKLIFQEVMRIRIRIVDPY